MENNKNHEVPLSELLERMSEKMGDVAVEGAGVELPADGSWMQDIPGAAEEIEAGKHFVQPDSMPVPPLNPTPEAPQPVVVPVGHEWRPSQPS